MGDSWLQVDHCVWAILGYKYTTAYGRSLSLVTSRSLRMGDLNWLQVDHCVWAILGYTLRMGDFCLHTAYRRSLVTNRPLRITMGDPWSHIVYGRALVTSKTLRMGDPYLWLQVDHCVWTILGYKLATA